MQYTAQKWLWNVHNQVKDTPHLIANCRQEILARNDQLGTQHDYLTKMANAIIDEDIGVAMYYRQLIKTQIIDQFGSNPSPMR